MDYQDEKVEPKKYDREQFKQDVREAVQPKKKAHEKASAVATKTKKSFLGIFEIII